MFAPVCVGLPNHGHYLGDRPWRALLDIASEVERVGLHGVAVVDHVVMSGSIDRYPYGAFPGGVDDPWLEPLTTLAAISSVTQWIRLTTAVLISPLRPAALLAKTSATLDALSGGRLDLGVGTGWQREEYEAIGIKWEDRHQLLDDQLAACHALWAGAPVDFTSPTVRLPGVHSSPRPLSGGIPIWIGGRLSDRNLARIVRWGSGWMPPPNDGPRRIAAGVRRLHEALQVAGRDRSSVRVRAAVRPIRDQRGRVDVAASLDGVTHLAAAGGTDLFVPLASWCPNSADAFEFLKSLGKAYRALSKLGAAGPVVHSGEDGIRPLRSRRA